MARLPFGVPKVNWIALPLVAALLAGCEGLALRQEQMAAMGAFDGCGCIATDCSSVRAFSGKAAAVAAGKDTRALGAKVTR